MLYASLLLVGLTTDLAGEVKTGRLDTVGVHMVHFILPDRFFFAIILPGRVCTVVEIIEEKDHVWLVFLAQGLDRARLINLDFDRMVL